MGQAEKNMKPEELGPWRGVTFGGSYCRPQVVLVVKNPPAKAADKRDAFSVPGLGRFPGEGNGNPLQYSFLENPMDRGA